MRSWPSAWNVLGMGVVWCVEVRGDRPNWRQGTERRLVMAVEDNKAMVRRFVEPWQTGNVAALDDLVADTYRLGDDGTLADLKAAIHATRLGLPDLTATI